MGTVANIKMESSKAMWTRGQHILYFTVQQTKNVHLLGIHMGPLKYLMRTVKEQLYTNAGNCGAAAVVTCRNHL